MFVNVCLCHVRDSLKGDQPSDQLAMLLCWLANVYFYVFIFRRLDFTYLKLAWNTCVAEDSLGLLILVIPPPGW